MIFCAERENVKEKYLFQNCGGVAYSKNCESVNKMMKIWQILKKRDSQDGHEHHVILWVSFLFHRKVRHFVLRTIRFPMKQKSPPGRIALRRRGVMSPMRPAAGGESCVAGFFFISELLQKS